MKFRVATFKEPTHVEIHAGVLKCECGTETVLAETTQGGTLWGGVVGNPEQRCPGCKRLWWCLDTVDCEALDG